MQRSVPLCSAGFSRFEASMAPPEVAPGADHGVDLVDEEDAARRRLELGDHRLQALLEVAAVAGPGQERAHVEGEDRRVEPAPRARRPWTMRRARPSARAVLPTPESPTIERIVLGGGGTAPGWSARPRARGRSGVDAAVDGLALRIDAIGHQRLVALACTTFSAATSSSAPCTGRGLVVAAAPWRCHG